MIAQKRLAILFLFVVTNLSFASLPMTDSEGKPLPSLAPMLENVNPAVVNIATYSTTQYDNNPLLNDPFFRHFFDLPNPRQQTQRRQQSAGSGVIVHAQQGLVLTNHHVINGADEIQVSLIDGRTLRASLLGSDPDLDVAVLKVQESDLQELPMADSNRALVGDFVVAIGNPFGLGQTVTTGIVSALGRSGIGLGYENFIQTDASINPGNSGGALVNLNGELLGINTAIIAPAGGNVGIGFAIPINMARAVMEQILTFGEVRRGQVGITMQELTPSLREAFGLKLGQLGVLIADVYENSSADDAGVQPGDIILSIDQQNIRSVAQVKSILATALIGKTIELELVRDGKSQIVNVEVEDPEALLANSPSLHPLLAGVLFANHSQGVLVENLSPKSRAAYSGLRPGDIVVNVNQRLVRKVDDMKAALRLSSREVLLKIVRDRQYYYIVIR
jgi:Do/DeqQ family serine protease